MNYNKNHEAYANSLPIPSSIVTNHLKLAKAEHLKVILYIFGNIAKTPSIQEICEATGVDKYDVEEALLYWEDAGLLIKSGAAPSKSEPEHKATVTNKKPTRSDVAKRGLEDKRIAHLLYEAQIKFGRNLKSNETTTLVWLCDDLGLDISVILIILQLAIDRNKCNIRFIESVATDWANRGITTLVDADNEIRKMALYDKSWSIVQSAFGIERRMPSTKEREYAFKWIDEWQLSPELLRYAYELCVDAKSKFSMAYTAKIIEGWHKNGYKTPQDVMKNNTQKSKNDDDKDLLKLFEQKVKNEN